MTEQSDLWRQLRTSLEKSGVTDLKEEDYAKLISITASWIITNALHKKFPQSSSAFTVSDWLLEEASKAFASVR